ncbi:DUF1257 domain-containing protein [Oscillatoria acuminata]|uniref:DUF1257 domain-containing protein n=1 Tax=Oscillatoria acuminata PCC 6304 TaxID=56110 RepID=K9TRZ5_9CYAN|nr:DUF1257 domain-containing protein [Oscillatoria acuminata]AFY84941.1 Protein of unknown function (DUF1257) [Oscillatoria acuminata PCC 6304]
MSHFTSIQTEIRQIEYLTKALADMGFESVELHEFPVPLYGFEGDIRPESAEVIVRRKFISSRSNDLGFKRQFDGTFMAVISDYDSRQFSRDWIQKLTQRYAYHALIGTAPQQGFTVEEEEVLEDGTIRVIIGQWV